MDAEADSGEMKLGIIKDQLTIIHNDPTLLGTTMQAIEAILALKSISLDGVYEGLRQDIETIINNAELYKQTPTKHQRAHSHVTKRIKVFAHVDIGIIRLVNYLNSIPGVYTTCSCQGYWSGPWVMVELDKNDEVAKNQLISEFNMTEHDSTDRYYCGIIYPGSEWVDSE